MTGTQRGRPELIGVVVRFHHYDTANPEHCVDLMKAFRSVDEADAEAARLNEVVSKNPRLRDKVQYFVKIARYATEAKGLQAEK